MNVDSGHGIHGYCNKKFQWIQISDYESSASKWPYIIMIERIEHEKWCK